MKNTFWTPRRFPLKAAAGACLALCIALQSPPTLAQTIQLDMPVQPLAQALDQLAQHSGLQLAYPPDAVEGRTAPAMRGQHSVQESLQWLLKGTPLQGRVQGNTLIVTSKPTISASQASSAASLPEVVVTATTMDATSEGSNSYAAQATSIMKGNQSLKAIPQSVSVLTRKQLDDQNIVDLRDAANAVTGVVGAMGVGQGMVLSARGFQIDAWQNDGVAIPRNMWALGNWGTDGMVYYDRLEVLRGASGLLQGTGSPGGAVNMVRKRGQAEQAVALTARAGSWDRYGMQLDAGGPLNDEGSLRGRVVLDESRSHSFIDYVNDRTRTLYAAVDYDLSPDTTVGLAVGSTDSKGRPMVIGLPRTPTGGDLHLPRSTYTGALWNHAQIKQTTVFADLDHRFNADWKLNISALHMDERTTSTHQRVQGAVAADGSGITYANWITDFDSTKAGLDAYVTGHFEAFGLRHKITTGANYSKYTSNDVWTRTFTPGGNIYELDHNRPKPTEEGLLAAGGVQNRSNYDTRQKGLYTSWRAQLSEPLTAIAGLRLSWYDYLYHVPLTNSRTVNTASGEVTPYFGLVYALSPEWSAYGSYTSVFEPQSAVTASGEVLEPIMGSNYELGIKGELLDRRVNTSLAVFRYDHKNRAVNDVASGMVCSGWYCSIASGKVRSQGVEAEISGEVARNLQLMAGYTFNTTKFLSDPTNQGKVFSTWTPNHMLRVQAAYQLPGDWSQLSVGAGISLQSHTLSYDRSFSVPGFGIANARLAYQIDSEWNLALNVNNLFDKRYWAPGFNTQTGNNNYGDPRNVMFTLKYTPKW